MCDQTEIEYLDGDVVWVKLGSCWWPGAVVGFEKLPPDVLPSFRKPPIAVVKFFQEDSFEYVKNIANIYKYNCSRKNEFIKKGLEKSKSNNANMQKFSGDVVHAEELTNGDVDILTTEQFQEKKKESYANLFGDKNKTPGHGKKGRPAKNDSPDSPSRVSTPNRKFSKGNPDYKVHILVQSKPEPAALSTPSTSRAGSEPADDKGESPVKVSTPMPSTPTTTSGGVYSCHACSFHTNRLNVMILHNKSHSSTYIPYTPSPAKKKPAPKPKATPKSAATTPKTTKPKKPREEKDKNEKSEPKTKKSQTNKRPSNEPCKGDAKKKKTDDEIKTSLLADWDDDDRDDVDEDSKDESKVEAAPSSPETPMAAKSPALPNTDDISSAKVPDEGQKKPEEPSSSDKSDAKYDFCEDEEWPIEGVSRKIPRIKSSKRKEEAKSLDDDDMAREIAELLNSTTVPQLPAAPEPLRVEENFPERPVAKSPDKPPEKVKQPSVTAENKDNNSRKTIFKTKTFFRSRHSRSQDAIGKYVAEQLNAAERMDTSECDINGADITSSPDARESPPIENIRVVKLAPKIQLKKMKADAEAAQLREKEKIESATTSDDFKPKVVETFDVVATAIKPPVHVTETSDIIVSTIAPPSKPLDTIATTIALPAETSDSVVPTKAPPAEKSDIIVTPVALPVHIQTDTSDNIVSQIAPSVNDSVTLGINNTPLASPLNVDKTSENIATLNAPSVNDSVTSDIIDAQIAPPVSDIETSGIMNTPIVPPAIEETTETETPPLNVIDDRESVPEDIVLNIDIPVPSAQAESPQPSIVDVDQFLNTPITTTNFELKDKTLSYLSESTASAVDALLSVSRENDRVTKIVSKDLPEDLFEEDNKTESTNGDNIVGNNTSQENSGILFNPKKCEDKLEPKTNSQKIINNDLSKFSMDYTPDDDFIINTTQSIEPTVSDLQVAEALMNLPSTTMKNKSVLRKSFDKTYSKDVKSSFSMLRNDKRLEPTLTRNDGDEIVDANSRFETEQEKSENLNAAQSLVQMSEALSEHKVKKIDKNIILNNTLPLISPGLSSKNKGEVLKPSLDVMPHLINQCDTTNGNNIKIDTTPSKLIKILENETIAPKITPQKVCPVRTVSNVVQGKEKILNVDVSKSPLKTSQSPKQKIIIRRTTPSKTLFNKLSDSTKETLVLSRTSEPAADTSAVQTYTIKGTPDVPNDSNTIIIQQKSRTLTNMTKIQKVKPKPSFIAVTSEVKTVTPVEDVFDINSMPVVLSEDIVTAENIDKMPIVMSDGNLLTNQVKPLVTPPVKAPLTPLAPLKSAPLAPLTKVVSKPKIIKHIVSQEKMTVSSARSEPKTLLMNPVTEVITKSATPNILSKSSKLRGGKPMLVIDKTTGRQKLIMAKAEPPTKEIKQVPAKIQSVPQLTSGKGEKFIILPAANSPKPRSTQKIVIDHQTGKAHVLVAKPAESVATTAESKPVSAKLIPAATNPSNPGGTVMIITNAQGTQSRIVLTPEHEKLLFPNKQITQLKAVPQRVIASPSPPPRTQTIVAAVQQQPTRVPAKAPTKIVTKPKPSAIITSKGQLIVGGRVTSSSPNIAPMPEIRPTLTKRIVTSEPKKIVPKTNSEPLIFLQHKSGAVMQLTPAQFEHLQRTGQIVQKTVAPAPTPSHDNKIVIQKSVTITSQESLLAAVQKPKPHKSRGGKTLIHTPTPPKKAKREIVIKQVSSAPVPSLTPIQRTSLLEPVRTRPSLIEPVRTQTIVSGTQPIIASVPAPSTSSFSALDNFEELLPSTAIARLPESMLVAAEQVIEAPLQPEPVTQLAAVPEPMHQEETVIEQDIAREQEMLAQQEAIAQQEALIQQEALAQHELAQQQELAQQGGELTAPIAESQLLAIPGEHFGGPPNTFYLCVEDNGTLTPIDNRPLVLDNNQLVPMAEPVLVQQPERRDILEAALANSDVFQAEPPRNDVPDFRDLNANVSVHCIVSETSTTLNQPIMTPVEVPSKFDAEPSVATNLEDGLAVIGVTPHAIPTSLELPITVTDPRIAPKTTDPLTNASFNTMLTTGSDASYVSAEEMPTSHPGPISMPLLTDDDGVGKSMPILTDDVNERIASSVESTIGSPYSIDVRESETDEQANWSGRVLTSGSDSSEGSAEIPLQPAIQISVDDITENS